MTRLDRSSSWPSAETVGRRLKNSVVWTALPLLGAVGGFGWLTYHVKALGERLDTERVELTTVRAEASALRMEKRSLDAEVKRLREDRTNVAAETDRLRKDVERERHKLAESKRIADLVQEMALGARTPEQRSRTLYAAARNAMEVKDYQRAQTLLKAAIDENPAHADAFNAIGLVSARLDADWHSAEAYYLRAVELNPQHVYALHNLADLYMWHKDYPKAREFAERALRARPDYVPAKQLLYQLDVKETK